MVIVTPIFAKKVQKNMHILNKTTKTMNNHEHKIHYTFGKDGYCSKQCPHCDFLLRVGSEKCYQCTHFVSHDYIRQIVTCKCPENHKLTDFEPSIFFQ